MAAHKIGNDKGQDEAREDRNKGLPPARQLQPEPFPAARATEINGVHIYTANLPAASRTLRFHGSLPPLNGSGAPL